MIVSLALFTFALIHIPGFKTSSTYLPLTSFITMLLLYMLGTKRDSGGFRGLILFSTLLLHVIIVYTPPQGVVLDERSPALARMAIEGFYDPSRPLLSHTYNPFPMDRGLLLMFAEVTYLSPIAELSEWLISLFLLLAIDLILYSIIRRLTGSWTAGVLAILMFATSPPLSSVDHHSKLAGLMLVLVATFVLTLAFKSRVSSWKALTAMLVYTAGIFYHATAGLGIFVLSSILVAGFLLRRFMREGKWEDIYQSRVFRITLVTFIVITLARWIYGGGFEETIVPSIRGYIFQMLGWGTEEGMAAPLYERAGVNPIQAYAWSTPVAIAAALILYTIIKRRSPWGALIPSLAIGGGTFLMIGFLGGYFRAGGFAASMYPGFCMMMPAAASVACRILRSSTISALVLVSLLTASTVVAVQDPMLSSAGWTVELKGSPKGGEEHYLIASTLLSITPSGKNTKAPYEIAQSIRYLNPFVKVELFSYNPRDPAVYSTDPLVVQGYVEPDTLYVLRSDQLEHLLKTNLNESQIDLLFCNGKYFGFVESE